MISVESPEIGDVRSVASDFFDRHRVVLDDDDSPGTTVPRGCGRARTSG